MPQKYNAAIPTIYNSRWIGRGESPKFRVYDTNVSSPPTDAELDAAFGTPAQVGDGWSCIIDDNGAGLAFWLVISAGGAWVYEQLSIAV